MSLNETEKRIMKEYFLEVTAKAKEINPKIAKLESKLNEKLQELEDKIGKKFISDGIEDTILEYKEAWVIYIYDTVNNLRDCFDKLKNNF